MEAVSSATLEAPLVATLYQVSFTLTSLTGLPLTEVTLAEVTSTFATAVSPEAV